jgi:hypothetical protein
MHKQTAVDLAPPVRTVFFDYLLEVRPVGRVLETRPTDFACYVFTYDDGRAVNAATFQGCRQYAPLILYARLRGDVAMHSLRAVRRYRVGVFAERFEHILEIHGRVKIVRVRYQNVLDVGALLYLLQNPLPVRVPVMLQTVGPFDVFYTVVANLRENFTEARVTRAVLY